MLSVKSRTMVDLIKTKKNFLLERLSGTLQSNYLMELLAEDENTISDDIDDVIM